MDPETAIRIADLQSWIGILAVTVVLLCAYVVSAPEIDKRLDRKPVVDPTCPLHRTPRSRCSPESHEDSDADAGGAVATGTTDPPSFVAYVWQRTA